MNELGAIIRSNAQRFNLDPILIAAVVLQESTGDQFAFRFEPAFLNRYIKDKTPAQLGGLWPVVTGDRAADDRAIEFHKRLRSCSFGLMQLMLQTAVELGFKGLPVEDLFVPSINIELGCKKIARCVLAVKKRMPHLEDLPLWREVLLCFNGGGDPTYPGKVLKRAGNGTAAQLIK